jgi:xanthine dehydrogenase YagS FAD-binding subunit
VKAFRYERAKTLAAASRALAEGDALLKANGVDVLDRLKERVDEPARVVTIVDVPGLDRIEAAADGTLRIGAMTMLAALAASPDVAKAFPALAEAAGSAASPQLRNRATVGGNLAQHTRCGYYRHRSFPCWKRDGSPCPVIAPGGVQETAAIFGNGSCASAHPSSLAPVLGAAAAQVVVVGPRGERRVDVPGLYEAPRAKKPSDTTLAPGEVIAAVEIPPRPTPQRSAYVEVRQRAAYDWALVSCAAWISPGEGPVKEARIFLGAVAPYPWRATGAEKAIVGKALTAETAAAAGRAALEGAQPLPGNRYKADLVEVVVRRALLAAGGRR